jgi:hypothetical protein
LPSPEPERFPHRTVATAWAGTWTGEGTGNPDADGQLQPRTSSFRVTLTLHTAARGELAGKQVSNVSEVGTGREVGCTEALEVREVHGSTATFEAVTSHPTDRSATGLSCPKGNVYVVRLTGDDTMTLGEEGAQAAGAPSALTPRPQGRSALWQDQCMSVQRLPSGLMRLPSVPRGPHSSWRSPWSKGSALSIGSVDSFLSIGSVGSVLSVASVGSFLSVGSVGSAASLASVGSWLSTGSALSARSSGAALSWRAHHRTRAAAVVTATAVTVTALGVLYAYASRKP